MSVLPPDETAVGETEPVTDTQAPTEELADESAGRPNPRAWLHVTVWGVAAFIAITVATIVLDDDHELGPAVLRVLAVTAAVTATCGVLAFVSESAWHWWLYPPIVVLPAVAVVALTALSPDRNETTDPSADQGNRTLTAPDTAGPWTNATGPEVAARAADFQASIARADDSLQTVYGEYHRAGSDLLIYNGITAAKADLVQELIGDPESVLEDRLRGTGVRDVVFIDPGELGGAMACGTVPQTGPYVDLPSCGWADSAGIGQATYRVDGINPELAADLTREFRSQVECPG